MGAKRPLVSIVVRMYNEALHLNRLFTKIGEQTLQDFELIAVDSGSTDGSLEIARKYCRKVREISSRDFTFGFSLNQGIEVAEGEYVAIVSAHTVPASDQWLQQLVNALERHPNSVLAYGRQLGVPESKLAETLDFGRIFPAVSVEQRAPHYYCNNANSMIRRATWLEHRFDEALTGLEDQAWAKHWMDQGRTVVYVPDAPIYHIHNETWSQVENRHYREAVAARHIGLLRRRHLLLQGAEVAGFLAQDLATLIGSGRLRAGNLKQISKYRYRQLRGVVRGTLHNVQAGERQEVFFPEKNSAVVIRGPGQAAQELISVPQLKPNDVLIKVVAVGVCSTDLEVFRGSLGYFKSGLSQFPIVPGHEYCGEIVSTGARVPGKFKSGMPVVGECILSCLKCEACLAGRHIACKERKEVGVMRHNGAYASLVALPADFVHPISETSPDLRRYALVEPLAVVHKAISRLSPERRGRRKVAVLGAGPIGNFSAQLLRREGDDVTIFDLQADRLAHLTSLGIQGELAIERLERFDTIVETTGSASVLETVLSSASPDGELLLLGFPYGPMKYNFEDVVSYDRRIIGSVGSSTVDFKAAIELIPQLSLDPFLQKTMPISHFEEAWEVHESKKWLKVLLVHEGAR